MSLFTLVIALHVIVAIVGVGLLGAIPIVASWARQATVSAAERATVLEPLFRYTRVSLVLVFLSGGAADYSAQGAFHTAGWFRASALLVIAIAIMQIRASLIMRKGLTSTDVLGALRRVERSSWASCGAVVVIAFLMAAKPF